MKKVFSIITALLMLLFSGCSGLTPSQQSLKNLRRKASSAICAVAYIGNVKENTYNAVRQCVKQSGLTEKYRFLNDIPDQDIIIVSGEDVFCIVPVSPKAMVSVHATKFDDDMDTVKSSMQQYREGLPIILVCNVSDIYTNSKVKVKDGSKNIEFAPYISLRDGTLETGAPEGTVYDFNPLPAK